MSVNNINYQIIIMTDDIGGNYTATFMMRYIDFETENVIAEFKFKLTKWTLNQYASMDDVLVRNAYSLL